VTGDPEPHPGTDGLSPAPAGTDAAGQVEQTAVLSNDVCRVRREPGGTESPCASVF